MHAKIAARVLDAVGSGRAQTTLSLVETKPGRNREILLHYEAVR